MVLFTIITMVTSSVLVAMMTIDDNCKIWDAIVGTLLLVVATVNLS